MKRAFIAMALCISMGASAQNVGIGNSSPNTNAKLDITATDKGVLIPRMDSTHRKAIPNTIGLLVYDSTTNSFWYNNGTAWQNMATAASGWSLTGNAGIDTSINFLGTTDNKPLLLRQNNIFAGKIDNTGTSIGVNSYSAGNNAGDARGTTAIGIGALHNNVIISGGHGGIDNTAIGLLTLYNNTSGAQNTAVGAWALNQNDAGTQNTAAGASSMLKNTTGSNNTAVGNAALHENQIGNANTAVGTNALTNNIADNNVAMGYNSLTANTAGTNNTAVGNGSLFINTGGSDNTAIGNGSLQFNLTGNNNAALGKWASGQSTDASNNTAVGAYALFYTYAGSNNTAIGYKADMPWYSHEYTNTTVIGANAIVDASNKIRLGDANVTVVESNGVFNTVSDGRFKYNIQENVKGLDFIMKLRPVTYQFNTKKQEDFTKGNLTAEQLNSTALPVAFNENDKIKRTGFIAQEVAAAAEKTGYDFDGVKIPATDKQYYSLSYASFVVPLVKAVQEQQQLIAALKKQNELLQQQNEMAQQQNRIILKRLDALENKK